ncbi:hypothetical protein MSIMFB_00266 [Mycobacterium simulans]|uniref:Histidine kinase/HSP90-like ATPase domain-containing protein n=1 Tax=Mycobacterium simulans TaxID=627089 RepID=A0A7Z7IG31_9MYCO|nr:hypothetical protein MSIMFB_00266 [Mycobacterium simulans]
MAHCLDATDTSLRRYEPDNTATLVAAHDDPGHTEQKPVGTRWPVDGDNIVARVARTGAAVIGSRQAKPLPPDSEQRIGEFTELVATDIANAEAHDGAGGADSDKGSGIIGLIDRVEALGGHLRVLSPPGAGTTLDIVIPQ